MSLNKILEDIDFCIDQYRKNPNKNHYRLYRSQTIQANNLKKGEYTYYYAMCKERTQISMYDIKNE